MNAVNYLIATIHLISLVLTLVVLADMLASYLLSPFHPVRRALDGFVNPLLAPIRRVLPPVGMWDFSPVVLIVLIRLIEEVLVRLLLSVA